MRVTPIRLAAALASIISVAGCKPDTVKCPGTASPAAYPDYHNGGDGTCVPLGECITGYHDGGGGVCVMSGCAVGYFSDGAGVCINDATQCTLRFHDDGSHHGCAATGQCATGFRLGGDDECVAVAMCSQGFHDGGSGMCLPQGECSPTFHDGGAGDCTREGLCSQTFFDDGEGRCVNNVSMCGGGFHDGGNHVSCVLGGTCNGGYMLDGNGDCVGGPSTDGGVSDGGGIPTCCDASVPVDPCAGTTSCGLSTRSTVTFGATGATSTDVQVKVTLPVVTWKSTDGTLRSDCTDLVFRNPDNSWAPHWVEDCTAGTVWVRIKRLDAATGAVIGVHHGGAAMASTASFDRVFDRVPSTDPALATAWTFDEGAGTTTRNYGAPAFAWHGPVGTTDPANKVFSGPQAAALWAPQGGGWGSRADTGVRFSTGHAARISDRVTWQTDPANTPKPASGLTVGAWFTTNEAPGAPGSIGHDNAWTTVLCYGATEGWPFAIANPFGLFMWESDTDMIKVQGNSCHNGCTSEGTFGVNRSDYDHMATTRWYTYADLVGSAAAPKWHFMALSLNYQTNVRHIYMDGVDEPIEPNDYFNNTPPSTGNIFWIPNAPIVLGADYNNGIDGLTLAGDLDDVFILNRAATVPELAAFRERRRPITLPSATVTTP
jgi:hypothetical protein